MDSTNKDLYLFKKRCLLLLLFFYYRAHVEHEYLLLRSFGFQFDPSCDYKVIIAKPGQETVKQAVHVFASLEECELSFQKGDNINFIRVNNFDSCPYPKGGLHIYFDGLSYYARGEFLGVAYDEKRHLEREKSVLQQLSQIEVGPISFSLWLMKFYAHHLKVDLVMGAGINKDYGAKDWNELIQALSEESYLGNKTSLKQTKHYVGDDVFTSPSMFKTQGFDTYRSLGHELYEFETAKSFFDPDSTLYQCVEFISAHPGTTVITYNYDTNLEYLLKKRSLLYCSTYDDSSFAAKNSVATIFHVHGLLPYECYNQEKFTSSLVFNEEDYFYLYNNPYSWNVAKQLHDFKFHTCFFIGISLKDPDMKRILGLANNPLKFNFIFMKREKGYNEKVFADISTYFFGFDLLVIWVDEYSQIGENLAQI